MKKSVKNLRSALATGLAATALLSACSSGSGSGDTSCTPERVYNSNFANYHSWQSYAYQGGAIAGSPHTAGPRREYINHVPSHGSKAFPDGTVIVKEIGNPPASQDSVFAMVKVGCDYNSQGAENWEWFELTIDAQNDAAIRWAGSEPPPGDVYAGDPTSCNACHADAKSNDYVQSQPLQLSNF
jgi:hypothetical protein